MAHPRFRPYRRYRTRISLLAAIVGSSTLAAAQPNPHTTTNPKAFTGYFSGHSNNSFPLGRTGGRIQFWRRGRDLAGTTLLVATGARPTQNQSAPAATISVELILANTTATYTTFSATFAQNLGTNPTVAVKRKSVSLPALSNHTDPDQPVVWLAHDTPFVYVGPNLIVQFDLGSAVNSALLSGRSFDAVPGGAVSHKRSAPSCGGTLVASGTGALFTLTLTGAPGNSPGALLVSNENVLLGNIPALPFRLDLLGMTGCFLGVDPTLSFGFVAGASGGMTWNLPINYTTTSNPDAVHTQVLHLTSSNTAGLATTNVTHSVLGGAGMATYCYNYTVDGPVAQYGPYASDRGAILLFKP